MASRPGASVVSNGGQMRTASSVGLSLMLVSASLFALFGCKSPYFVPHHELFNAQHVEASDYKLLAPVSCEYIQRIDRDHSDTVFAIIQNVEKRKDDPEALADYLARLKKVSSCADVYESPEWQYLTNGIRQADSMYFFEYSSGSYSDFGVLVLRQGDVVFRWPWGWNMNQPQGSTNEPPKGTTVNKL